MNTNRIVRTIGIVSAFVFMSCAGSNPSTFTENTPYTTVVGKVGSENVTYGELLQNYTTGSSSDSTSLDELESFLPVYLDYKAKIEAAKDAGYFENPDLLKEYELYSKQAAYAYWLEKEIRPTLFEEFKARFDKELKSSHVLIAVEPNATPDDTLKAYNSIVEAREKYFNGTSIEELDKAYSTVRNGRSMGGDLPWFSVGTTVKEFEDALYSLEVGELSMPVRTQFGYHIILLEDERVRIPERQLSHIFVRRNGDASKIQKAYEALENGTSWSQAVQEYSEDAPTINNGGYIGWVNSGSRFDAAFIDTVMNIDPELDYTSPIQTFYGYHIFKIDSVRSFNSEDERNNYIMGLLEDSNNFTKSNPFILNWLTDNYESYVNTEALNQTKKLYKNTDSLAVDEFTVSSVFGDEVLFKFENYSFSVNDYVDYNALNANSKYASNYNDNWFLDFKEAKMDSILTEFTLNGNPQFSNQTDSYLYGLVVYQINEDSVWSAATVDSSLLERRYESDLESYTYDDRYYYHLITSSRDTSLEKAINFVLAGNSPDSILVNDIAVGVTSDSTGAYTGDPFTKLESMQPGSFSDVFEYRNRNAVFYLNEILPARTMTFEEAFNRLLSEYQPEREQKWVERLRASYRTVAYPEKLLEAHQKQKAIQ
jgi:peptidyl-prolyl cis-trans isomerase SurA